MLYVDVPTRPEFKALNDVRADACVSIYLKTTPLTQQSDASRIELGNLAKQAREQLEAVGFDKRRLASLMEHFDDLADDDAFWRLQANSLAILATPDLLRTFRLANALSPMVAVSDRFHLKPLTAGDHIPQFCFCPGAFGERGAACRNPRRAARYRGQGGRSAEGRRKRARQVHPE